MKRAINSANWNGNPLRIETDFHIETFSRVDLRRSRLGHTEKTIDERHSSTVVSTWRSTWSTFPTRNGKKKCEKWAANRQTFPSSSFSSSSVPVAVFFFFRQFGGQWKGLAAAAAEEEVLLVDVDLRDR